jgi:hypothetical protein
MKYGTLSFAGFGLLLVIAASGATPAIAAGAEQMSGQAAIVLAQNESKKKDETVAQKVKRNVKKAWRNMTGYKFTVGCPAVVELNRYSCTETGKNREDARAKCQSRYALCSVSDAR